MVPLTPWPTLDGFPAHSTERHRDLPCGLQSSHMWTLPTGYLLSLTFPCEPHFIALPLLSGLLGLSLSLTNSSPPSGLGEDLGKPPQGSSL